MGSTDAQREIFVLPEKGMVIADKGYDTDIFSSLKSVIIGMAWMSSNLEIE